MSGFGHEWDMAKKKSNRSPQTGVVIEDKGYRVDAFSSLKTLQNIRQAELESRREAEAHREAEARRRREAFEAREAESRRELRFSEADLGDTSGMTDAEIFEASMAQWDRGDVYEQKFNAREEAKPEVREEAHLTLTEEEREFALFTQEMAVSKVQRLVTEKKLPRGCRRRVSAEQAFAPVSPVRVDARPSVPDPEMRTDYVAPSVAVTQVVKGEDVLEMPDVEEAMTASQKALIRDVHRYEARYGLVISLRLRGLTRNAAMSRLNDFLDACVRERKPYALVICGKGLGSDGAPVIKEGTVDALRHDSRVIEYAPVINADGDFGSVYIAVRQK